MKNEPASLNPITVFKETFNSEMRRYQPKDATTIRTIEVEAAQVDPNEILKTFDNSLDMLSKMFSKARVPVHGLSLESMDVSAEGQVGFLGTGVKATGTSSLKLTFSTTQDTALADSSNPSQPDSANQRATLNFD
jgi:hypothetical protein